MAVDTQVKAQYTVVEAEATADTIKEILGRKAEAQYKAEQEEAEQEDYIPMGKKARVAKGDPLKPGQLEAEEQEARYLEAMA